MKVHAYKEDYAIFIECVRTCPTISHLFGGNLRIHVSQSLSVLKMPRAYRKKVGSHLTRRAILARKRRSAALITVSGSNDVPQLPETEITSRNAMHACVLCDQNFSSKQQLQEHFREHGSQPLAVTTQFKPTNDTLATFECELCGKKSINVRTYWQHYQRFHPEWRGLDCPHCGKHFIHTSDFTRHRDEMHAEECEDVTMPCPQCESKFHNQTAMTCHMQVHNQVQQIETLLQEQSNKPSPPKRTRTHVTFALRASYCKLCQCQFSTSTALAQHLVVHGLFLCLTCGQELTTDESFRGHQSVHLPTSPEVLTVTAKLPVQRTKSKANAGTQI